MDKAKFGFAEGLTVTDGEVAHLLYDFSNGSSLVVNIIAARYIVHSVAPFPCTHVRLDAQMGGPIIVPVDRIDDQCFSFDVPDVIGAFIMSPD